jgi:hypothetical protein
MLLSWAHRVDGDHSAVQELVQPMLDGSVPRLGLYPWGPRLALAIDAFVRRRGHEVLDLYRPVRRDPLTGLAWALLLPGTRLLLGLWARPPSRGDIARAPRMGADGIFLVRAAIELFENAGQGDHAAWIRRRLDKACAAMGVEASAADPLVERFLDAPTE